ncbi:MAG: hypothetical protein LBN71_06055, partial [Tannerella sp.]|nr:hypothetical protein [Tannerella sp.]
IEPGVYYVYEDHNKDNNSFKFDMPLTVRFGYDFGYMDVAFSYKYGLANISDTEYYTGKIRNWQIQVFIPF